MCGADVSLDKQEKITRQIYQKILDVINKNKFKLHVFYDKKIQIEEL